MKTYIINIRVDDLDMYRSEIKKFAKILWESQVIIGLFGIETDLTMDELYQVPFITEVDESTTGVY